MQNTISCLIIGSNADNGAVIRRVCQRLNVSFFSITTHSGVLEEINANRVDFLFVDLSFIEDAAQDFLAEIGKRLPLSAIVVIGDDDTGSALISDNIFCILKPSLSDTSVYFLMRQMIRMLELNREVRLLHTRQRETLRNPDTGVYTDAYLKERIAAEFKRASRYILPLSVILVDLNFTESLGGRPAVLEVIRDCAKFVLKFARGNDVLIQHGDNQFLILLPDTSKKGAVIFGARIMKAFREHCPGIETAVPNLKVSVGIATYPDDGVKTDAGLLELASRALQHARSAEGDSVYAFKNIQMSDIKNIVSPKKKTS